jgi:hypothetical protein
VIQRYGIPAGGYVLAAVFLWLFIGAKSDIKAGIERCNTDKAVAVAEAEEITRIAAQDAADQRLRQLQAKLDREAAETAKERQKRLQAELRAEKRGQELRDLAEEAFDEDELPDSNACLNAFVTSRALRCVLYARDQTASGAGGGGEGSVCADPEGADGMHPGFSNITYLDVLRHWGGDRDAAIRLNGRLAAIEKLSGEVVE